MPHFTRKSCVAITWNAAGDCRAILMRRSGDKCRVVKTWNAMADRDRSVAELVAEAAKALNAKDAACSVAAGLGGGWGMADIVMPALPPDQMRNAISFELRKHTPLTQDKIRWGYRASLEQKDKKKGRNIRLVYVRNDIWEQWLDAISGLSQLDLVIPPPAVLDPLLSDKTIIFPNDKPQDATSYAPAEQGRDISHGVEAADQLPIDELIPAGFIKWDLITELPVKEQQAFAPAVVLATYGLTDAATQDAATLCQLPANLKPRRNIMMAMTASLLLTISVLALFFYFVVGLQARYDQMRRLEAELKKTTQEVEALQKLVKADKKKVLADLKNEMSGVMPSKPTLPFVLLDLSRSIPSPAWLSGNFIWDEGLVKFTLEEPVTDPTLTATIDSQELLDALEDSPYIGDVRGLKSSFDVRNSKRTRDFDLAARFDTPEEAAIAEKRNAIRKEVARQKAEQERKENEERRRQEKQAAEEEPEAETDVEVEEEEKPEETATDNTPRQVPAPRNLPLPPPPPGR